MPTNKIIYGPGRIPKASEFAIGEIIVNIDDSKVYSKDKRNVVFELGTTDTVNIAFSTASFHSESVADFTYLSNVDNQHLIFSASTGIRFTQGTSDNSVVITATGDSVEIATEADIADTASYVTSSNVDGPHGFDSVLSSSHALTASFFDGSVANAISSSYAITSSYAEVSDTASFVEASNIGGSIDVSQLDIIFGFGLDFNTVSTQLDVAGNITGSNISSSGNLFASLSFDSHDNVVVYDTSSGKLHYTSSDSLGGGDPVLQQDLTSVLPTSLNVGGVFDNETFTQGTQLETVLRNILIEYGQADITSFEVGEWTGASFNSLIAENSYEVGNSSSLDINSLRVTTSSDSLNQGFNVPFTINMTGNQSSVGSSLNTLNFDTTPFNIDGGIITHSISPTIHINRNTVGTVLINATAVGAYTGEGTYLDTFTLNQPFYSPIFFGGSTTEINESNINSTLLDTVLADISGSPTANSVGLRNISGIGYVNQAFIDSTSTAFPSPFKLAMPNNVTTPAAYTYIIYPNNFNDLTLINNGAMNEFYTFIKMGTATHTRYNLDTTYKIYRSVGHIPFNAGDLITLDD